MNLLIDTNVLVDVVAKREPFWTDSQKIWALAENGSIRGFVSVISFATVSYLARKYGGREEAHKALIRIRDTFSTVPCDDLIINQAIDAKWPDFEDAVQYFSALRAQADQIITRNVRHFCMPQFPVVTPSEFLAGDENQ